MATRIEPTSDTPLEVWKATAEDSNYRVSSLGRVECLGSKYRRGGFLKPFTNGKGYFRVYIGTKCFYVHRLVAHAFIPNPSSKTDVNHKNCDPSDNCRDNLEWSTRQENLMHASLNGRLKGRNHIRGEAHPMARRAKLRRALTALFTLALALSLSSCRHDVPPQIILCIGDGLGGADCSIPGVPEREYWPPSKLNDAWITTQDDAAKLLAWCYHTTPDKVTPIMMQTARHTVIPRPQALEPPTP